MALARFWQTRYFANVVLPTLLAFPYSLLYSLITLIFLQLSGYAVPWSRVITRIVLPEGLLNVAAMALIFPLLFWFNKRTRRGDLTI